MALSKEQLDAIIDNNNLLSSQPGVRNIQNQAGGGLSGRDFLNSIKSQSQTETQPTEQPQVQPQQEERGFFGRIGSDLKSRFGQLKETFSKTASGEINPLETGIRTVGDIVGAGTDILGEAITSGVKALTPDVVEESLKRTGAEFLQTPLGQAGLTAIREGVETWEEFKSEHPRASKNIEAVVNIGTILPAERAVGVGAKGARRVAGAGADVLEENLKRQTKKEAIEIIAPTAKSLSKAERESALGAGRGRFSPITGKFVLEPSERDLLAAKAVEDVISAKNKPTKNIENIVDKIRNQSQEIDNKLGNIQWQFEKNQLLTKLKNAKEESKVIFGGDTTLENNYNAVIDEMIRQVEKKGNNLSSLMQARRDFDKVIKDKFPKIFQDAGDNVRANAVLDVRRATNDFIAENAPERIIGIDVKNELIGISNMFRARDNIVRNVVSDLDTNAIQRTIKKLTGGLTGTVLLTGGITVGALSGILSNPLALATILGGGTYKIGKKIITSKKLKEAIKKMLEKASGRNLINAEEKKVFEKILSLPEPKTIIGQAPKDSSRVLSQEEANLILKELGTTEQRALRKLLEAPKTIIGQAPKDSSRVLSQEEAESLLKKLGAILVEEK